MLGVPLNERGGGRNVGVGGQAAGQDSHSAQGGNEFLHTLTVARKGPVRAGRAQESVDNAAVVEKFGTCQRAGL